jgi:hypothetical protein
MFATNRSERDTAMPAGMLNPEIRAGFTVAPEVVYSPIVPLPEFATNRSEPNTTMPAGLLNPERRSHHHRTRRHRRGTRRACCAS